MSIGNLTQEQGKKLVALAETVIDSYLNGKKTIPGKPEDKVFNEKGASFVTLKISGNLRGCIGRLEPITTLWKDVAENAVNAAFNDFRFSPLSRNEFVETRIEVSVMSTPVSLEYGYPGELTKRLQPGVDGVILQDGAKKATFLPQVWEQLPSPEIFLAHLCRKAGVDPSAYQEKILEIKTYTVQSFTCAGSCSCGQGGAKKDNQDTPERR
ncbi:AmmeMemoRadiSam system protein A [Desulfomarina sp.]